MIFFSLFSTAFSSIFYGLIVTIVIMAILYVVLKAFSKTVVETPVFLLTGVILAVLLLVQTSLMIGAIEAKDTTDSMEVYLNQLLENQSGVVGAQDSQRIMDAVTEQFPVIGSYINMADFSGRDLSEMASAMHQSMADYLSSYIWHRVWWILGIIVVASIVVMLFDKPNAAAARRAAPVNRHDGRRARTSGGHQRVSRRR